MTKKELISVVARKTDYGIEPITNVIDVVFKEIENEMERGGKVVLSNFGVFEAWKAPPKKAMNINTGEHLSIPARVMPRFRASKNLINKVRKEV